MCGCGSVRMKGLVTGCVLKEGLMGPRAWVGTPRSPCVPGDGFAPHLLPAPPHRAHAHGMLDASV